MSLPGRPFIGLLPPKEERPLSSFLSGKAGFKSLIRDNFAVSTWLSMGAAVQGLLYLAFGRVGLIPAFVLLAYKAFITYAMSVGWMHNTSMDGVILKKFSAQFPDETGQYPTKPSDSDVVVLLIGTRSNHPLGIFAPGFRELGGYFTTMAKELELRAEEWGYLGMTSWLNSNDRETSNMFLEVAYFKSVEGLHAFAYSDMHRKGWDWWNKIVKTHPHLTIFHEVYHAPKGHWENIYVNSHPALINSTTTKFVDEETGRDRWASPVVDASKGLLRTSAGRMSRSQTADEHDERGVSPY